jgi:ubiquinone/menaquinone biosynthesis C-methylase UbiE
MENDASFLEQYLSQAPIPLALVRSVDCRHLAKEPYEGVILDAGCGDGLLAKILFQGQPCKISVGIDADSNELMKAARTKVYKGIACSDMTNMPFRNNTFDAVISNSVLEHIPKLDLALQEIHRVLKPNALLAFTVPSVFLNDHLLFPRLFQKIGIPSLGKKYADFKNRVWKHYHVYSKELWLEKMAHLGFKVERCEYIHPEKLTAVCDLMTLSGAFSLMIRKIFGRLLLFPGSFRGKIFAPLFKKYYQMDHFVEGSTLFFVVRKGVL